mmetsp:Transcript_39657/g.55067  ORF Transcript_39657/g.55067 Transcript_39657/m.55067 type:complete len:169 (+) Transcript_39657:109-615(+)
MGAFNVLAVIWFMTHIPITLFMDSQIVLPRSAFPDAALQVGDWYVSMTHDPIVRAAPAWARGLVWCELLLQLPFFFVAARAYAKGACPWIRLPSVVYGAHTCTTLMPILMEIWYSPLVPSHRHRCILTGIYLPYVLVPMLIGVVEFISLSNSLSSQNSIKIGSSKKTH